MTYSPASIIFDTAGNEVSVVGGTAIPAGSSGLLIIGSDGTNARFLRVATDGTLRIDPTGTTPQPITDNGGSLTVDGTVNVGNFPGTQNVNLIQLVGNALAAGVGTVDPGTLRVVLANDQPSVTVDDGGASITVDGTVSVANFPATQNVNLIQLSGNAPSTGLGGAGTGTLRVVLATDQSVVPINDNAGSLTVDTPQLPVALVGGRLDANIGSWLGSTAPTVGQKTMTASVPVAIASNQSVIPVSDNAGSLTTDTPQLPGALVGGRLDANIGSWLGSTAPTVGQKASAASIPVVIPSDQSDLDVVPKDTNGLSLAAAANTSIPAAIQHLPLAGVDFGDIVRRVLTTTDGRLIISAAVAAPPGRIEVNVVQSGNVGATTDSFYTIPSGEQLLLQRFGGGGENDSSGSVVELYYAPNGNTTGLVLIRAGFVNGGNFEFTLDYSVPDLGNGTRAVLLRRRRLSGGSIEVVGFWDGYY